MDESAFFAFYAIVVVFLVYLFMRSPTKRQLRFRITPKKIQRYNPHEENTSGSNEKSLNCFFIFDGQTLDAFEVLEIPAGSAMTEINEAYENSLRLGSLDRNLLKAAHQALQEKA